MSGVTVERVSMVRIKNLDGASAFLTDLDKIVEALPDLMRHIDPMPDSMTVELSGVDHTRIYVTKGDLPDILEQLTALQKEEKFDVT